MSSDKTPDAESLADLVATAAEKAARSERATPTVTVRADSGNDATTRRPSRAVLVAAGIGVVAALAGGGVGFAIGHRGSGSGTAADSAALTLPASLSGGYQRSARVDSTIKPATQSAQDVLGAGTDMALYTKSKSQVLVEATRMSGNALLQAGMTYAKVGDTICATTSSASGSEAICSRTSGKLTVKVTASTSAVSAKYVDEVFNAVA
ncbi:MAG TPA: hypothetical protein VN088_04460 [Nocardioides sp.]|nr:hypothetical protein [Nocardioides sp.]